MQQRRPAPIGVRILVVDDDPQVRELIAVLLESAGYNVSRAESGTEALESLRRDRFHVMVLDLEMPDLDGFDVLKVTRTEFAHLKVLVVSGYLDGALLKAAECLGAAASLNKSQASHSLVKIVGRLAGDA
ncbi:MAG TPA: response regulator [Candidatus Acidoferrales bacterium]|jgi:CheY-like chemotaxis protein|nr:response regulator [Candidatus Acidoferrales bacterium]